ncbi:MAG: hypothetical protein RDV48_01780 [Candidatus Eremiobacteraeota bacterium]|nr:hypothetical protein [Candidatus Eremiobacteraeota bacterium]
MEEKAKDFSTVAGTFRKALEDALKDIGDIRDEIPQELQSAKKKIDRLEGAIKKQKQILESFIAGDKK